MRPLARKLLTGAALGGALLGQLWAGSASAAPPKAKGKPQPVASPDAKADKKAEAPAAEVPTVSLLDAMRNGQVDVKAEGTGDGRMTLSVTNQSSKPLRVVLPPGLVASGATGQFGGMGGMGMGGMGGGMGMMGGGMGGMGGGMGMMGGGMGGMGGGMGGGGMLTMPPQMGLMMLGMLIMNLIGDRDSWDFSSLMMGGGMGGMGMMGGGMGGGMGGMGGMGMGGMGMMSIPPTGLPHATLRPGQARHLPTRLVNLNGPDGDRYVALPKKGEPLQIGDIGQLTDSPKVQTALRRLAAEKAPDTVAQLVVWKLTSDLDWKAIGRLSKAWANAQELSLARHFVAGLDNDQEISPAADSGVLYWEATTQVAALEGLAEELGGLLKDKALLGLQVRAGIPERPEGPALACRIRLTGTAAAPEALVTVSATDSAGSAWTPMGKFSLPLAAGAKQPLKAEAVAAAAAEGVLNRLVRVQLTKGQKVKGRETYKVRIDNASPLVLNGLALAGTDEAAVPAAESKGPAAAAPKAAALVGLSVAPRRSLTVGASGEVVERLGLKKGVRVTAADLGGL